MQVTISEEIANQRVDVALSKITEFSRSMIQKMIYAEKIRCNGEPVKKANHIVQLDEIYELEQLEQNITYIKPQEGDFEILFEDDDIILINKPAHLIVHPGAGNPDRTLINYLAHYLKNKNQELSDFNGAERLGVIHRLDKGVSGCIALAKTNKAHMELAKQFQERTVHKEYIAICYDNNKNFANEGLLEDYIARGNHDRKKMVCAHQEPVEENIVMQYANLNKPKNYQPTQQIDDDEEDDENIQGKYAKMEYEILERKNGLAKILCKPHTGRMHQIRVQLASRKMPIIGDKLYGKNHNIKLEKILGERIALHAVSLIFYHPISSNTQKITADIPAEFEQLLIS